ncbi:S-adenosyl-L-methionine-dependent methyltransferases superfamily protein [Actinidia rufa]|uniref:S-adenosyl-L-methionine-dependent methyltransferases superfamily protein n=1 Tax=Actinidia rufa TaxID=165716 RepID=A0A7J0GC22_9ERIC|nr:S-adenosyl-L-methionine-dependent methyltransferases superfamily protein [Actinidia rufa]
MRCFAKAIPKVGLYSFPISLWKNVSDKRYVKARGKNDFLIDNVLALGSGGIKIGFDLGGGSSTFVAVMAERNVTVSHGKEKGFNPVNRTIWVQKTEMGCGREG